MDVFGGICLFVSQFVCLYTRQLPYDSMSDDETWQLDAWYKNLTQVQMSRSKVKVTRDKTGKTATSSPLTMPCNACAVLHGEGNFRQLACGVYLVKRLSL